MPIDLKGDPPGGNGLEVVPWKALLALIEPYYPKTGRPAETVPAGHDAADHRGVELDEESGWGGHAGYCCHSS